MKNITFWSSVSGKSGTSGNMLAISAMSSVLYSIKTLLVQFDRDSRSLSHVLEEGRNETVLNEEFSFYNRKGLDEIWDKSRLNKIGKDEIRDNLVQVRHTNLYYMPTSRKSAAEQYQEFDESFLKSLLNGMKDLKSVNFIDCMNGKNEIQKVLFEDSELIVVNLCQGMSGLDELMEEITNRDKVLFVIGRYDRQSRENVVNIRRRYNISKDAIGVIPYNIHFHDAMNEGRLIPFISKGIFNKKTDEDYEFILELFHTTNMILRKAGYEGI